MGIDKVAKLDDAAAMRGLWTAVITQAVMDLKSESKKSEARREKKAASEWLTTDCPDFHDVCDMADLNPDYTHHKIQEALKNKCQWRLPAGQGWRTQKRLKSEQQGD